jgi:hypothetical protein
MNYQDKNSSTPTKTNHTSGREGSTDLRFISTAILYMCATALLITHIKTCAVTGTVIDDCRRACDAWGSRMDTVTANKCVCADRDDFIEVEKDTDIWALPRSTK